MIFEIIMGGKNWLGGERMGRPTFSPGKEWAGPFFPQGKNWLGGNSGLLHRYFLAFSTRIYWLDIIYSSQPCFKPEGRTHKWIKG